MYLVVDSFGQCAKHGRGHYLSKYSAFKLEGTGSSQMLVRFRSPVS